MIHFFRFRVIFMTKTILPALVITAPAQTETLSPDQKTFNRLSKQIAKTRQQMADWESAMLAVQKRVIDDLIPLRAEHRQLRIQLLLQLDTIGLTQKLGKADSEALSRMIALLAEDLMAESPDPQLQEIYSRHGGSEEERRARFAEMKAAMADFFGLDPEADGMEKGDTAVNEEWEDSPEAFAERLRARMEEQLRGTQSQRETHQRERPQTAQQKAREARQAEQAGRIRQSLQGIYRRLVSAVHPDREVDTEIRAHKTALMQRVNQAYAENDLMQLLALQHELGQMDTETISALGEGHLKTYNQALKEHLAVLKQKIQELQQRLASGLGMPFFVLQSPNALSRNLQETIAATRKAIIALRQEMNQLSQPAYLKRWLKTARRELAAQDDMNDYYF